ncbi:hypothetical protein [Phytohabitans aurantiacus]|uniref:Uncharacterized protein n=1 Tax=Phytohabitans aurantiacus TaxID=3016789 RepID=A0ABQ5QU12_9ACTN|nr:hypothetical protein [Phytohabitans aurantiacus]GLH97362.1 hypothetical protein Pa4123_26370 [Phytohabitans aurantiacus]
MTTPALEPTGRDDAVDRLTLAAARLLATATHRPTEVTVSLRQLDGLAVAVEQLAPGLVDRVQHGAQLP